MNNKQGMYKTFTEELTNVIGKSSLLAFTEACNAYFFSKETVSLSVKECISVCGYNGKERTIFSSLHEITEYLISEEIVESHQEINDKLGAILSVTFWNDSKVSREKMKSLDEMYKNELKIIINW